MFDLLLHFLHNDHGERAMLIAFCTDVLPALRARWGLL